MQPCIDVIDAYLAVWQSVAVAMVICIVSCHAAYFLKLNRPWPLAAILGAILTKIFLDAVPCDEIILGRYTFLPIWLIFSVLVYCPDWFIGKRRKPRNVWDYFEEVDSASPTHRQGATSWYDS